MALAEAADSPGYPQTSGTAALRESIAGYLTRRWGATGLAPDATLPVIGTKELVAWPPTLLGLGSDDLVVFPTMAYPTYEVGARIAGCRSAVVDDLTTLSETPALVWLNSPGNPTGQILPAEELRQGSPGARDRGAIVASDECYGEFGWDAEPVSVPIPRSATATTLVCWRCIRSRSGPTWPAIGPDSWPATPTWSGSCWPYVSTPG